MRHYPHNSVALLPSTQVLFNARAVDLPRLKEIWDSNTVYVIQEMYTEKIVYACSCGDLGSEFAVGTTHQVHHDQRLNNLGHFKVMNVVDVKDGKVIKQANNFYPRNGAPVWVFK